ncbi:MULTISPECIES: alpha/beta fold hydrolase [unclassified Rhizobium]|uniref:alpha/beta hydrolase n=1 Tax=unclassified Rhizobium TaxID=2613769 RepID=UPI001A996832|nr:MULTISPECIES: alpha/beta fold hydrolase [unclassified Rhizobium]MBX5161251.1 alpha/beta fold hydrolase [Rhizobium sp. NZLR8]MBX5172975.1 alpha/beta fold hydrolase [Rhizobium sp. NZLR1b]MBX5199668.1 alpha/beta fold hydrolase [Rhizobium sp. NZLR10]MBX5206002.1 alpha/beta fold hydrolase [Rhizobium sp. NZLR1]QSZ19250.1 alpha/beta fold hydrolase [Rhizobium sp. NZLR1]
MANFARKVTRLGFSLLQAVSPDLAGRAAFLLFCRTPSPRPKGAKAKAAHAAGAARLDGAERFTLRLAGGAKTHAYRLNGGARGRRKRYLVTHGWGSSTEYMAELVSMLSATGAEVVALDFPGHGRASRRFLHMGLAVKAIAAIEARFGAFDAVIGHSFGGAALVVSVAGLLPDVAPVTAERLVLIGAPSEMAWLFTDFGRMIGLRPAAQAALENEVRHVTGRRLEDFDAGDAASAIGRPVLVIHAEDDKEVPPAHAKRYQAAGEGVRLFWANGFGHRRILAAAPVLAAIAAFLGAVQGEEDMADEGIKNAAEIIPFFELPVKRAAL